MIVRYLTHPEVVIDANVPVQNWGLSEVGHARIKSLIKSGLLNGTTHVFSSDERKARDGAEPIADALGAMLMILPNTHENDRSSTGFLEPADFEATADAFFGAPLVSVRGWETANDAQARIVSEVDAALKRPSDGDVLFVGHGAVGTLLFCHLASEPISRKLDQFDGGGCLFSFDAETRVPHGRWRKIEDFL